MCTWSGCRCPSSIRLSFCAANLWNTSPRCCRIWPNNVFLLHLGMNTTWYLHPTWCDLSFHTRPSMESPSCALAAHDSDLRRWASAAHPAYSRNCQTSTATPAEPGGLPGLLGRAFWTPALAWFACRSEGRGRARHTRYDLTPVSNAG